MSFYADVAEHLLEQAKKATDYPRAVLATSLAETAIILPDVDIVIDLGVSCASTEYYDVLVMSDSLASEATRKQRMCCAGRHKPGCSILVPARDKPFAPIARACDSDSVARVLALHA